MNLYRWTSEYLRAFAPGDIIVQAKTVDEARSKILVDFDAHLEWHRQDVWDDYVGTYGEPDSTSYREQLNRLRDDISRPPEVIHGVLWIRGSS